MSSDQEVNDGLTSFTGPVGPRVRCTNPVKRGAALFVGILGKYDLIFTDDEGLGTPEGMTGQNKSDFQAFSRYLLWHIKDMADEVTNPSRIRGSKSEEVVIPPPTTEPPPTPLVEDSTAEPGSPRANFLRQAEQFVRYEEPPLDDRDYDLQEEIRPWDRDNARITTVDVESAPMPLNIPSLPSFSVIPQPPPDGSVSGRIY